MTPPPTTTTRKKRSETRQRRSMTAMRLLPDEHEQIRAAAADSGVSVSEFMRRAVLKELHTV